MSAGRTAIDIAGDRKGTSDEMGKRLRSYPGETNMVDGVREKIF
jgi:hypothetical protein